MKELIEKRKKTICLKDQMFQLLLIGTRGKRLPQPTQGKFKFDILQNGIKIKISVLAYACNLLKIRCKINMELCCLLGSRVTNLFMTPQMTKCLGIKIEKLVDPIMVHLAQGIVRPL
jgi:hypothetical protein